MSHKDTKNATTSLGGLSRAFEASWVSLTVLCALCAFVVKGQALAQSPREVVASRAGWRPAVVNLKKGEPARLLLKTDDDEHCFAVDELRIEKRIVPGKATTLEVTADRAGNFAFYDCLNPEGKKGRLVVSE